VNLRPSKREPIDLNLTPLIDVVFLLLIFFMVSTTFDKESRIKVELPTAATQDEQVEEDKILDITVDSKGRFYVNQKEVINTKADILQRAIEKDVGDKRDLPVVITVDAQAPFQAAFKVMDVTSRMGFVNMTFPGKRPAPQSTPE